MCKDGEWGIISIHTTTQVVTNVVIAELKKLIISIHTTTQVVTWRSVGMGGGVKYFNPHHHAGGDV